MPGSSKSSREAGSIRFAPQHVFVAGVPVALAMMSLLGLRGLGGFYLSPALSFALGVAALATATQLRRSRSGREFQALCEIGLALAIAACGAAALAALIIGA